MWKTLEQFANWNQIKEKLEELAHKKHTSEGIIDLLHEFKYYSHIDQNPKKNENSSSFATLCKLYNKELPDIFSRVAHFVLDHPKHQIPLFLQGEDKQHTFTKQNILYLYCTMMLGLIPRQLFDSSPEERGKFNYLMDFSYILSEDEYKTKTVIQYLKQEIDNKNSYNQKMSIHRQVEKRSIEQIIAENKQNPMSKLTFESNQASIEDFYGDLKADFANKYLGGGALMSGCVQEEIMFTNHPELFTAQLLCEVMKPNECLFLLGYKKYFRNTGYGWTATFDGPENHKYKYDQSNQAMEFITAIDALQYGGRNYMAQFQDKIIDREILKAYCGFNFKSPIVKRVVTGNWGCGAFGGNLCVKFLVQWLACSLAKKEMVYCPFGESQKINDKQLIQKIQKFNVGQTYDLIHRACAKIKKEETHSDIYKAMKDLL